MRSINLNFIFYRSILFFNEFQEKMVFTTFKCVEQIINFRYCVYEYVCRLPLFSQPGGCVSSVCTSTQTLMRGSTFKK